MAKVTDINYYLNNVEQKKLPVNCNSSGVFNVNLPKEIAESLGIDEKLLDNNLSNLITDFHEKIAIYEKSAIEESLHILIAYHVIGKYNYRENGFVLHNNKKHNIDVSFGSVDNAVGLDFVVAIKKSMNGVDNWYKAELGSEFPHFLEESKSSEIYHPKEKIYPHEFKRYKMIPFDQKALDKLNHIQENFRKLSEILYNFINQDEAKILENLMDTKFMIEK